MIPGEGLRSVIAWRESTRELVSKQKLLKLQVECIAMFHFLHFLLFLINLRGLYVRQLTDTLKGESDSIHDQRVITIVATERYPYCHAIQICTCTRHKRCLVVAALVSQRFLQSVTTNKVSSLFSKLIYGFGSAAKVIAHIFSFLVARYPGYM